MVDDPAALDPGLIRVVHDPRCGLRRRQLDHVHCSRLDHLGRRGSTAAAATQSTGQTTLQLEANSGGALEFNTKSLEAPMGKVTIVMTNPSSVPHNIAITGNGVSVIGPSSRVEPSRSSRRT
jgi:hypothetical protein